MKTETAVALILVAVGAWWIWKKADPVAEEQSRIHAIIFGLPMELSAAEKKAMRPSTGAVVGQGAISGAEGGAVFGPWGAGIGAAAGAAGAYILHDA